MCGDIIKTMHRASSKRGQERGIADHQPRDTASPPMIGRLAPERSPVAGGQGGATNFATWTVLS
jgi:hypothetical protein